MWIKYDKNDETTFPRLISKDKDGDSCSDNILVIVKNQLIDGSYNKFVKIGKFCVTPKYKYWKVPGTCTQVTHWMPLPDISEIEV